MIQVQEVSKKHTQQKQELIEYRKSTTLRKVLFGSLSNIPFFPKLRRCQIRESPCWYQGCCSFQKPGFTCCTSTINWIGKRTNKKQQVKTWKTWALPSGQTNANKKWKTWAINSSFSVRVSPPAAFAFNSQRSRFEQSSWSFTSIIL